MFIWLNIFSRSISMYYLLNRVGLIVFFIYNFILFAKKKSDLGSVFDSFYLSKDRNHVNLSYLLKKQTLCQFLEKVLIVFGSIYPLLFMNYYFGYLVTGDANYFGSLYTFPYFFFPIPIILGVNPFKIYDEIVPGYALSLVFAKLACFCSGCCAGIEWKHGLYNYACDKVMFPVQLLEAVLALLIFIFLL